MSVADQISRGVKATFGARVIDIVANAALMIVLARFLLTTDEYGRLYVAISVIGVASLLGTLGIPASAARYVTEYQERDSRQVPHILRRSLVFVLGLGLITSVFLVISAPYIAPIVLDDTSLVPLLLFGAIYVIFEALMKLFINLFQAFNRVSLSALVTSINAVGRLIFAVLLSVAGLGAVGALSGYVIGFALAAVVGAFILYDRFYHRETQAETMETGLTRRIMEYSIPLTATRSATVVDKKVDTILVGALLGATPAAFYTVAKQISEACIAPASALGFTISPTFGKDKAGHRLDQAARLYEDSLENMLILYVPALVGLVLVAEPMVVQVFGEAYRPATPVVQVMGVFVLANSVNKITTDSLDYLGRARDRAIAKTIMASANFILNIILITLIGVVGAAIATAITFSSYAIYCVYIITKELPIQFDRISHSIVRVCLISGGMGFVVLYLRPYITGIVTLFVVIGSGMMVWAVLSVAWGLIDVKRVWSFLSFS